mgnify:CR=1 FL=1
MHGFRRLSVGKEPELAMPVGALAADAGIVLANVMGLFLQACLYEVNGLDGAAVPFQIQHVGVGQGRVLSHHEIRDAAHRPEAASWPSYSKPDI